MSLGILLQTLRTEIPTALSLDAAACVISLDDRPPVSPLALVIALRDAGSQVRGEHYLQQTYAIDITLWLFTGGVLRDRLATKLADATAETTLDQRQRELIAAVHGNWALITAANTLAASRGVTGFPSPLQVQSIAATRSVTGDGHQSWLARRVGVSCGS